MAARLDNFILLLLVASLGLNVYLGWHAKRQRAALPEVQTSLKLVPGMSVRQITATTLHGREETIDYGNSHKPTVLYVFSPACGWCNKNHENINAIANQKSDKFRFLALSLSNRDLERYVETHKLSFPVYRNVGPESIELLGLGPTPQTIVIGPDGRVLKNWLGAYGSTIQSQVEEFFGVRLPGLKG